MSAPQPTKQTGRPIILPIACPYCTLNSEQGLVGCTCGYLAELGTREGKEPS